MALISFRESMYSCQYGNQQVIRELFADIRKLFMNRKLITQTEVFTGLVSLIKMALKLHNFVLGISIPFGSVYAKPLYNADNRPKPMRGVVRLNVRTYGLSKTLQ